MDLVDEYKPLQLRREKLMEMVKDKSLSKTERKKLAYELHYEIPDAQADILAKIKNTGRGDLPHPTDGEGIYKYLVEREGTIRPTATMDGIEQTVSEMLDAYGIEGRRWMDRLSTDYPDVYNTQNYVVFNENIAKILERNEMPVGKTTGASLPVSGAINIGFSGDPRRAADLVDMQGGILDRFGHTILGDDKISAPKLSIYDQEGKSFVSAHGDLSRGGGVLLDLDGIPLKSPVEMMAGQDFMWLPESVKRNLVWASANEPIQKLVNQAKKTFDETGVEPIFIPFRGKPGSMDFSKQVADTMIQSALSRLNKFQIEELNDTIRKEAFFQPKNKKGEAPKERQMLGIDYKGIDAENPLKGTGGELRKEIIRIMDRDYRMDGGQKIKITGEGSASAAQARVANADPDLLDVEPMTIQNVAQLDMDNLTANYSGHHTYPVGLRGEAKGKITEDVSILDLFDSSIKDKKGNVIGPYLGSDKKPMTSQNWTDYGYRKTQMDSIGGLLTHERLMNLEKNLKRKEGLL